MHSQTGSQLEDNCSLGNRLGLMLFKRCEYSNLLLCFTRRIRKDSSERRIPKDVGCLEATAGMNKKFDEYHHFSSIPQWRIRIFVVH